MPQSPVSKKHRILNSDGSSAVYQIGRPSERRWSHAGHALLTMSWGRFSAVLAASYVILNLIFALGYWSCGECVVGARSDSFEDRIFFSVQTIATIGYGQMTPLGLIANILVAIEALVGMLFLALVAGLVYARFTRPTSGVQFSDRAVIGRFDGKPTFMLRISNARGDSIIEASASLTMARDEKSDGLGTFRRLYDLTLVRSTTPTFNLSWTMMHVIDESSPLFGKTARQLADERIEFLVLFTGHHEGFDQRIHARHAYAAEDLVWHARFVDMVIDLPSGRRAIDFNNFNQVEPLPDLLDP